MLAHQKDGEECPLLPSCTGFQTFVAAVTVAVVADQSNSAGRKGSSWMHYPSSSFLDPPRSSVPFGDGTEGMLPSTDEMFPARASSDDFLSLDDDDDDGGDAEEGG